MSTAGVSFSVIGHAAWAPGLSARETWVDWAQAPWPIGPQGEPGVVAMPAMQRRRLGQLGKMALEVGYECLGTATDVPTVFCSRHGETSRAVALLGDLVRGEPLSPTAFGMSVHNATTGMFSIARADRANHVALAAGTSTLEHAVIDACGLLADGAPRVLLIACDTPLPEVFADFADRVEQPHAFAWLMAPGAGLRLDWEAAPGEEVAGGAPGSLDVLRFFLAEQASLERVAERRRWRWTRAL